MVFVDKVLTPLLMLGVLIFVHELGHFLVAKWCGVGVVKFSIGFGPSLFRFRRRETTYQLSAIPLGGFVRMVGDIPDGLTGSQTTDTVVRNEENAEDSKVVPDEPLPIELQRMIEDRRYWFIEKGVFARSAIVFAGPLFNFLFSIVVIFVLVLAYGEAQDVAKIGLVAPDSPAQASGLQPGDLVLSINGVKVDGFIDMKNRINGGTGDPIALEIQRNHEKLTLTATPQKRTTLDENGAEKAAYLIGVGPSDDLPMKSVPFGRALILGVTRTFDITVQTYAGLWGMMTGKISAENLRGPIFIFSTAGKQAEKGFDDVLWLAALLSVSLAVLNLLPIPILDGGHLMFFLIEAVIGPISIRKKEVAQQVGMALLLCLMVFAVRNDIWGETPTPKRVDIKWQEGEKGGAVKTPASPGKSPAEQSAPIGAESGGVIK